MERQDGLPILSITGLAFGKLSSDHDGVILAVYARVLPRNLATILTQRFLHILAKLLLVLSYERLIDPPNLLTPSIE